MVLKLEISHPLPLKKKKKTTLYLTSGEKSVNTKKLFNKYFTYPKFIN